MGRHALLVGTATCHADRQLQPLPSVRHDVAQLKAELDTAGDFDRVEDHLDLPSDQFRHVVEEFYGARRDHDLALFYYSGHGVLHTDRQSLFLAAADTVVGQLHASAFDVDGILRHLLNDTKASQKVVLLDCCFSGAFTARHRFRGGVREEPRRTKRERGTFMLTASNHMQASKVQSPDRPSLFTEVLLEGLRGGVQGTADDGWTTTNDLSRYVLTEMARRSGHAPVESSEGVTEPIRLVAATGAGPRGDVSRTEVGRTTADDAPFDPDQWRRLLDYYVRCMRRSAVLKSFIDPSKRHTYVPARSGGEAVLTATAPIRLDGPASGLAEQVRADGKALQYGYPVVAVHRRRRRREVRLAPLLVCDVTVGDDGLAHPEAPRPNPALADEHQLSPVEVDELTKEVDRVFVPGNPSALETVATLVMETFGLSPETSVDPATLKGTVNDGPADRVQNTGVFYVVDVKESPERALVDDLEDVARKSGLIGGTALGALAARPPRAQSFTGATVAVGPVNEAQEEIIQASMSQRLTVAQGPPGTGKSQLVTALLATATAAGQSVLIGSTNNRAVDEVVERIVAAVGPGLLVRTGNKEYLQQEPGQLAAVLAQYQSAGTGRTTDERTTLHELRLLTEEVSSLRGTLDERRTVERDLADLAAQRSPGPAYDTDDSLSAVLPDDHAALARLVEVIDRAQASRWLGWWYRRRLRRQGVVGHDAVAALGERAVVELRWRDRQKQLAALADVDPTWRRLVDLLTTERPERSKELLCAQIRRRVVADADLLQDRADEMAGPRAKSWAFFPDLLRVLPGWATTAMSARRLPLRPGMFDLVIIDEAAQCTVPAVLPMLYRAKRALLIGDPRQLTPVVELPEEEDRAERTRAGLSEDWLTARRLGYRSYSAYGAFAATAGATHLLDEHYRCHPDIVDVPNREVYQGRLTVLTDVARLAARAEVAVRWQDVRGEYHQGATGSGRNELEIDAVVDAVRRLRGDFPGARIGVVTPLAAHQHSLARRLHAAGLDDGVLCGTVHKFQGSERDIMVISPVGARGVPPRTRSWLVHQTNLWNVAITRARAQLLVVGDRSWWSGQGGLLAALAAAPPAAMASDAAIGAVDRLHRALSATGLSVRRDVVLAARRVDLVVHGGPRELAVVVDDPAGDSDGRLLRKTLARLDVMAAESAVRRVPTWRCLAEPQRVAAELSAELLQVPVQVVPPDFAEESTWTATSGST